MTEESTPGSDAPAEGTRSDYGRGYMDGLEDAHIARAAVAARRADRRRALARLAGAAARDGVLYGACYALVSLLFRERGRS